MEPEVRVEVVLPSSIKGRVLKAMLIAHPYEEPAYDIIRLEQKTNVMGLGRVGHLVEPMLLKDFVEFVKVQLDVPHLRVVGDLSSTISKVAVKNSELCSCSKVTSCDWMRGIHTPGECLFDFVEVRFKNNRKDFYRLPDGLSVTEGDVVAVEGMPGHDVGIVSLTGEACRIQMRKKGVDINSEGIKKLFRRAKVVDIERWADSIKDEQATLRRTRQIAEELGLVMKVNDVEYQGDHSKAIFYYTADERVDFRNLIKVLAEEFKVRVEPVSMVAPHAHLITVG